MQRKTPILAVALALACTNDPDPGDDGASETPLSFVLVHGAWMGAWSWERVVPELEDAGHDVTVVELPAHGDDDSDPSAATLDGYRDTVLAAIDRPSVLVGHSMGGVVISAAAEARRASRPMRSATCSAAIARPPTSRSSRNAIDPSRVRRSRRRSP